VYQTVSDEIKAMPPNVPFENNSYSARKEFEITQLETQAVHSRLVKIAEYLQGRVKLDPSDNSIHIKL
jgi:hypothetical protein